MITPIATNWQTDEFVYAQGRFYSDPDKVPADPGGDTYDGLTPTLYANPSGALGDGSGDSEANAMALSTAMSSAVAGDIVGILPGVGTGTVAPVDPRQTPSWRPSNSGSSGNPIIFVGKYPWDSENHTELRSGSTIDGEGAPAFGTLSEDYIEWINIYVNEAVSASCPDTGPVVLWDTVGSAIRKCRVIGDTAYLPGDNHNGVRIEGGADCTVEDSTISGFYSGPGQTRNGSCITTYGAENVTIRNNALSECATGMYIKGTASSGTMFNHGLIAYNEISDISVGMRLEAIDPVDDLTVEHNLVRDFDGAGIVFDTSAGAAETRNILAQRNTLVTSVEAGSGLFNVRAITGAGNSFNDNLVVVYTTTNQQYVVGGDYTANDFDAFDYNGFYGSTAGEPWSWNGAGQSDITELQAAIANSNNNQILANNPLANIGSGDYTVTGAATTASSTGGPIGADYSQVGPR